MPVSVSTFYQFMHSRWILRGICVCDKGQQLLTSTKLSFSVLTCALLKASDSTEPVLPFNMAWAPAKMKRCCCCTLVGAWGWAGWRLLAEREREERGRAALRATPAQGDGGSAWWPKCLAPQWWAIRDICTECLLTGCPNSAPPSLGSDLL